MVQQFLERCLALDLETSRDGQILEIGAVLGERSFVWRGDSPLAAALAELDRFGAGAGFLLGHNLLGHDLPALADWCGKTGARPALLALPAIDTLVLSPLAFPENPYHRLIKDYKLVRDAASDPVADARLAMRLCGDELRTFAALAAREPERLAFYAFCFGAGATGAERQADDHGGLAGVFSALSGMPPLTGAAASAYLAASLAGRVCVRALAAAAGAGVAPLPAWAFAAAWLQVAGGRSVLPRWVRARYPRTVELLDALRGRPCGDPACAYCGANDLEALLQRLLGFPAFRPAPAAADGGSLQRELVEQGLDGRQLLAVLPTGGGKSLCYQLPALIRHHRRGQLTIVVSPLQALMQDQVAQLNLRAGRDAAAALTGLLTPLERGATLDRVRLGEVAILYVSPEQLRNRSVVETIEQREIGAWVFDEAHCLSKWGHDFRPDYLYASRVIRELAKRQQRPAPPPVCCFTATAKPDVRREIVEHFRRELGAELAVLGASARRPELSFAVEAVAPAAKLGRIRELLDRHFAAMPQGAALVYFASRAGADRGARHLAAQGVAAAAFHAGLRPPEKRRILDQFLRGELRVVCATNAFGMGIDKEDVRLVLHADIPGSLESYLQEAGRAGRDRRPAHCILLFAEPDVERQFRLAADSRVGQRDIVQILLGLRRLARRQRGGGRQVVVTSGELLGGAGVDTGIHRGDRGADTKVKTAVGWLERAGFVERNHNHTRVFQGRPRVADLAAAARRIDEVRPRPSPGRRALWLEILGAIFACDPDQGLTADQLAGLPACTGDAAEGALAAAAPGAAGAAGAAEMPGEAAAGGPAEVDDAAAAAELAGERVLRALHEMAEHGLIESGMQLTAFLQPRRGGRGSARARLQALCRLELAMLEALREAAPEAEDGAWCELSLRRLNQRLRDGGLASHPETLRQLLQGLARRDRIAPGRQGLLDLAYRSREHYGVRLQGRWAELTELAARRRAVAQVVLAALLARVADGPSGAGQVPAGGRAAAAPAVPDDTAVREPAALREPVAAQEAARAAEATAGAVAAEDGAAPAARPAAGQAQVAFALEDLVQALRFDLLLGPQIADPLAAVERGLLFLHEQQVIQLQHGLAVFRQAMTIRIQPQPRGRGFGDRHFAPLAAHYAERTAQIHVMARYAEAGLRDGEAALALVDDYFALDRESFVRRRFPGEEAAMLGRATAPESYRAIVESLANRAQIELVTAPAAANLLILAGPGAGKTRVVVHRCAYLLRVERVPARGILVVCFNRGAAREVARRLRRLAGDDARGLIVQTYHGLALLLTGTSLAEAARRGEEPDFARLIADANRLLRDGEVGGGGGGGGGGNEGGAGGAASRDEDERAAAAGLGAPLRERLLAGFSHILVDEYQDVNDAQYELLSNLAGRRQADPDRKLSILAVGDDDQTIYGFGGAKVEFIRRFHHDYGAGVQYLIENFRSTAAIIAAANRLIEHNHARLKQDHPIRIDAARAAEPAGGRWAALDAAGGGRVRLLRAAGAGEQAAAVAAWLHELRRLDPELAWPRCAVLARTHGELAPIRAVCEHRQIPIRWSGEGERLPPLHRIREIAGFLATLAASRTATCRASELLARCAAGGPPAHPWWSLLREVLAEWAEASGDAETAGSRVLEFLYEALAERRREPALGEGVHLGTVHAAKGLEFAHVALADGGWGPRRGGSPPVTEAALAAEEEERRLFYVGMTRARETLTLLWRRDESNPFVRELLARRPRLDLCERQPDLEPPPAAVLARRFELLGMRDLFLDFAGRRPGGDPIHERLALLQPGSPLALRDGRGERGDRGDRGGGGGGDVELVDASGMAVAALSRRCRELRAGVIAGAEEVRVVAMIERRRADSEAEFQPSLRCERWQVPLVEIRYRLQAP
jgi:ATP-dependent DNA helicase RecQ